MLNFHTPVQYQEKLIISEVAISCISYSSGPGNSYKDGFEFIKWYNTTNSQFHFEIVKRSK